MVYVVITGSALERRRIVIQGIVQGVGFRPFVYGQALHWGLVGFVLNDSGGVTNEVEGTSELLDGFQRALREKAPPLARIDTLTAEPIALCFDSLFSIAQSKALRDKHLSLLILRRSTTACMNSSNKETGASTIRLSIALTADLALRLSRMCPMIEIRRRCVYSLCAENARESPRIHSTGAFTHSRMPAKSAGHRFTYSIKRETEHYPFRQKTEQRYSQGRPINRR